MHSVQVVFSISLLFYLCAVHFSRLLARLAAGVVVVHLIEEFVLVRSAFNCKSVNAASTAGRLACVRQLTLAHCYFAVWIGELSDPS